MIIILPQTIHPRRVYDLDSTQYDFGSRLLLQMEDNKTYNINGCLLRYYELRTMLFYISFIFTWHLYCINMLIILIYGNYMYDYTFISIVH